MNTLEKKNGVWFVYDGDCPICTYAAQALKIKRDYGQLHMVNAREPNDDHRSLIEEITRRGLDLDEGMVIYLDQKFYHGKEALTFIANYGESKNILMASFKALFWSNTLSTLLYPWMRGARNLLVKRKNIGRIDNLALKNQPTFKSIFGDQWDELPLVMKKHYANRPYTEEKTTVKGVLEITSKPPLLWFSPLMTCLGQIPVRNERDVPVTVHFESDLDSKSFYFNRTFHFRQGQHYTFRSRMMQIAGNEVIEIMKFRLGWKMHYFWNGEKVVMSHKGYALHLFGHFIPLPLTMLLGAGYAEERPVDDNTFEMNVHINHAWWGKIYEYKGHFEVVD